MSDLPTTRNIAETILDIVPKLGAVQSIMTPNEPVSPAAPMVVAVPDGLSIKDLTGEMHRVMQTLKPFQRTGTAQLTDLESFIEWTNRHSGPASVIFATVGAEPSMTAMIDYHGMGAPTDSIAEIDPLASHCRHRALYRFPLSAEWKLWQKAHGVAMDRATFGEFIEANAKDLLDPTPALLSPGSVQNPEAWEERMLGIATQLQGRFGQYATLVQLARHFQVHETSNLTATLNRDTGESQIQFLNEHQAPDGSPIKIPNLFMIAIPIFENGALYRLAVRFRYRKAGSDVKFIMSLHNADVAARDAVDEALARAAEETKLPVFRGKPETA